MNWYFWWISGTYNMMQALYALCMNDKCSMCTESKAALPGRIIQMHWHFFKKISCFLFILRVLLRFLQSMVHAFKSPCNLNASIGKQPTVIVSTSIYAPAANQKRLKIIWWSNNFINSSQFNIKSFQNSFLKPLCYLDKIWCVYL